MAKFTEQKFFDKIYTLRDQKVMLDKDLAEFYDIPVKILNQAVRRNISRFPKDFMFQLTWEESEKIKSIIITSENTVQEPQRSRSQIVTLDTPVLKRGNNTKHLPNAFTEHWITMLASVLNSEKAIAVNIQIIRAFIKMRHFLQDTNNLHSKIKILESEIKKELQNLSHTSDFHDQQIQNLYDLLNQFYNTNDEWENREKIWFKTK